MTISPTQLKTAFANLINAAPNKLTVTIGGTDYDAVKTTLGREIKYSDFGVQNEYRFSVLISKAAFSSLPNVDDLATIDSVVYRIIGMETDSTDVSIRFDLGQKYA